MATATLLKDNLEGFKGHAALYHLSPSLKGYDIFEDEEEKQYEYVVVSAISVPVIGDVETYIFGADENGEIQNWSELPGSFKGAMDHRQALENAGYEVV